MSRSAPERQSESAARLDARAVVVRRAARAAAVLSRRLRGGSGLVVSGRVMLAGAPQAVGAMSVGRRTTLVSATNGKTTTTGLIVAALDDGQPVTTNRDGANTSAGIAGALAASDATRTVLEVDEGWLPWAVRETRPGTVALANLSRDQLSRHHEVGAVSSAWRRGLAGVPLVVANADDPDVVWPALASRRQVWVSLGARWTADSLVCPSCGGSCRREGSSWSCARCGLHRPNPDWWLDGDVLRGPSSATPLSLQLPGRFNLANAALAVVAAHASEGVPPEVAAARLAAIETIAGRFQRVTWQGHDLRLMLAKNPAGWLELLDLLAPEDHPVVLLFNAEGVDGRDPSWLYDVTFEALRGREVVVQGLRATDLLVRLRHDGVEARHAPGTLANALWRLPAGRVDVVGNYTAFRAATREVRRG